MTKYQCIKSYIEQIFKDIMETYRYHPDYVLLGYTNECTYFRYPLNLTGYEYWVAPNFISDVLMMFNEGELLGDPNWLMVEEMIKDVGKRIYPRPIQFITMEKRR